MHSHKNTHSRCHVCAGLVLLLTHYFQIGLAAAGPVEDALASIVLVRTPRGLGTGFLIENQSLIATNFHVIDGVDSAHAEFQDGTVIPISGFYVASPGYDLAILQLKSPSAAKPLTPCLDRVDLGTDVFAVGAPKGLAGSVSKGVVSAYRRWNDLEPLLKDELHRFGYELASSWVQTDAAINSGNSGGPLVLADGRVLAVNTLGSPADVGQNINFAVSASHLQDFLDRMPDKPLALAALPPGPKGRDAPMRETSDDATKKLWIAISNVLGKYEVGRQKLRIKMGTFKPKSQGALLRLAFEPATANRLAAQAEEMKPVEIRRLESRLIRAATASEMPMTDLILKHTELFGVLAFTSGSLPRLAVAEKKRIDEMQRRQRASANATLGVQTAFLLEEMAKDTRATRSKFDSAINNLSELQKVASETVFALEALPTQNADAAVIEFLLDLARSLRGASVKTAQAITALELLRTGGPSVEAGEASYVLGESFKRVDELIHVAGADLRNQLKAALGEELPPVAFIPQDALPLFEGETAELK